MLERATKLQGYTLHAQDGDLGKVRTFYTDDDEWGIHYLVVDTSNWFSGKYVLLPVDVLGKLDRDKQRLFVSLTREEVQNSPEVPKHTGPSAADQMAMPAPAHRSVYWSMDPFVLQAMAARPGGIPVPVGVSEPPPNPVPLDMQGSGSPLRSTREIVGYYIQARDGEIGHVEDFLIDPETWHVRYMVVDTRNWLPGKKVIVSPRWIEAVRWDDMHVVVDLLREQIKHSPVFDSHMVDRAYEQQLFDFYGRERYWE
jgi:hypothetical protein